ncbi:MAG: multicomponent Na+:H+ antiporter subunit D [Halioglobus sp.]|jgi:multicomponent Na+:H+ antiporter subunit D
MTLFPIFFAEIENDLRRVLAYSLNNQLGFMVVGVGIGTELSLNGTAAHAFCHILYKSLLFMSVGAVLYRTGTSKASELGGLYKTMPVTMVCCLIGAASISAFPLFSGFVSKSLILDATATNGYYLVWLALLIASAGVLSHSGIKIPYFTFFAHDSGKRPAEAPIHMRIAMILTAAGCVIIGVFPDLLYSLLPYEIDYQPYTFDHVLVQMQLLLFALLAFVFLMKTGVHPPEVRATNIDTDVVYRKFIPSIFPVIVTAVVSANRSLRVAALGVVGGGLSLVEKISKPGAPLARGWSVASMMFVVTVLMCLVLILNLW